MKYIFFTGAPGSTWSGIAKRIYWSPDIDHSDYIKGDREYMPSKLPAHTGAYWDPGMEFELGDWDSPFSGKGVRLIKSHTLAEHLEYIKIDYPDCPIVMVWRNNDLCYKWWHDAGGWDISYPNYKPFYQNSDRMKKQIHIQNKSILNFVESNLDHIIEVSSPLEINNVLGIEDTPQFNPLYPKENLHHVRLAGEWLASDIRIFVYTP